MAEHALLPHTGAADYGRRPLPATALVLGLLPFMQGARAAADYFITQRRNASLTGVLRMIVFAKGFINNF